MNKLLAFFIICAYVLGVIGGIGYAIYGGSYPIAVAIAVLGVIAFPTFKKAFMTLKGC